MPAIGYVTKADDGSFKGQLKTLSISADIAIVLTALARKLAAVMVSMWKHDAPFSTKGAESGQLVQMDRTIEFGEEVSSGEGSSRAWERFLGWDHENSAVPKP